VCASTVQIKEISMLYRNVCLETFACELPPNVLTSAELEAQLCPAYGRLRLPEGRLELMTGIRERRLWDRDMLPSAASTLAGRKALAQADVAPEAVDCLLHCSVSRDSVEPASSTAVHHALNLRGEALNFDISNACLGVLSGMITAANMIELGQINTALIVSGENSRPLLETTVRVLNADQSLTRKSIKPYFASLTIGSCATAVLLTHRSVSRAGHRFLGGAYYCNTAGSHLCQGDSSGGMTGGSEVMMATDSEELLLRGVEVAEKTWNMTKRELGWTNQSPDLVCTHQVGKAHRDLLFKSLQLQVEKNVSTFEFLGNCGSASLPATVALAAEQGRLKSGDLLAMLGIGSGINSTMLAVEW
jgi:3-oxoacyl-[acyl-carrier-protein] synthase-3